MTLKEIEEMLIRRINNINENFGKGSTDGLLSLSNAVVALESVKRMQKLGWEDD